MTNSLLLERITAQSESTPHIRNTDVFVVTILESIAEGLTIEEILERHSGLEVDDIRAVAAYAAKILDLAPISAEKRAIERLKDENDLTQWITVVEEEQDIDEEALDKWLEKRGYKKKVSS